MFKLHEFLDPQILRLFLNLEMFDRVHTVQVKKIQSVRTPIKGTLFILYINASDKEVIFVS